jgi:hypothetical protein
VPRAIASEPIAAPSEPAEAQAPVPTAGRGHRGRFGGEADIGFCVEETNRYRARAKKPPFSRSTLLDKFAAEGARVDHRAREAHHHFNTARFPASFSGLAENELPWWHLDPEGGVKAAIRAGVAAMWDEGPGGGHYENIVGKFSEMGCGIYIEGEELTVVQDFREP